MSLFKLLMKQFVRHNSVASDEIASYGGDLMGKGSNSSRKFFNSAKLGSSSLGCRADVDGMTYHSDRLACRSDIQSLEQRRLMSVNNIIPYMLAPLGDAPAIVAPLVRVIESKEPVRQTVKATITPTTNTTVMVLSGVHVSALSSTLSAGTALTAKYQWNFGDPSSSYNSYDGFNAAHVYTAPGNYVIGLLVTDEAGKSSKTTLNITVIPSTRRVIYVSKAGNDANNGSSTTSAVATPARALQLAGNNAEILLRRGDTWDLTSAVSVNGTNVVIGAYGTGNAPVLRQASTSLMDLISISGTSSIVTIQDLAFDSATPTNLEKNGAARAVKAAGSNIVVKGCTFINVSDGVNGESQPKAVLVQDNKTASITSVRAYFSWVQGSDWVFLGNYAENSTREHIIRVGGADRVNAEYNNFSNQDRSWLGDPKDIGKGVFTLQVGSYINIGYNNVNWGPVGVGPLGGVDGVNTPDARTKWVVFRGNVIYGATMNISPGSENVMVEDNVITSNGNIGINITPTDLTTNASTGALVYPARNLVNVTIRYNTGFNNSVNGRFINLARASNPGQIKLTNNLYVAPQLQTGYNQNAAVYVGASDLASFSTISANIWPVPSVTPGNSGAAMYVWPSWWNAAGYLPVATWLSKSPVTGDLFNATAIPDSSVAASATSATYQATANGVTAGARIKRQ